MTQCGAKTRQGGECKQRAGWGTEHPGSGKCKLHGGNAGRKVEHGRYSIVRRKALQDKIDHFISDPAAGDLRSELALLRALLQDYLDRFEEGLPLPAADIQRMFEMVDAIGKMVERIAKIMATTALTQAELQLIQAAFIHALPEFIKDADQQRVFVSRVFGQVRELLPSDTIDG